MRFGRTWGSRTNTHLPTRTIPLETGHRLEQTARNGNHVNDYRNETRVLSILGGGASVPLGMPTTNAGSQRSISGRISGKLIS